MSLGRFILTVLLASMLAGCAGTVARERTAAAESTVQQAQGSMAGQAQTGPTGNRAGLSPRARKRPKINVKPRQAATQDTEPQKKTGTGASSEGAASSPKSAAGTPASSGQLAGAGSGASSGVAASGSKGAAGTPASPGQLAGAGSGASSGGAASSSKGAAGTPASSGQLAGAGSGASSGDEGSIPGNSAPVPAGAAQSVQNNSGNEGVVGPKTSPGREPAATGAVAETGAKSGGVPAQATTPAVRPSVAAAGGAEAGTGTAGESEGSPQVAVLQPGNKAAGRSKAAARPKPPSFEERSLDCDVIELMGKFIGQRHIRGEPRVEATDKAIDDVLRQTGGERDERFVFSGRVYGMLIYRLARDHSAEGYGVYARSACRILRGGKGIVPADESSEYQLNQALRTCESGSRTGDELYSCISRRMEEIVQKRGS